MKIKKQIPEEELVPLLLKKSPKGLEILYDNFSASLFGVIQRIVPNEEIAEELLNKTFSKIWNNISQYNPARDRLSAWMINHARNTAMESLRMTDSLNKSQYKSVENLMADADPAKLTGIGAECKGMKELIGKMDIGYSQILYLLFFAGFSQSEVALKLNIPLGTIKTRSRTAILKLRNYLDKIPG